jgi:probable HAF family extracellular repeat protein
MRLLFGKNVVSSAAAINDLGHITGRFWSPNGWRAYYYDGNTPIDIGTIGGDYAWGGDINASNDIVGGCTVANGALHAFLWTGGTMYDLNTLLDKPTDFPLWHGRGINDQGLIVADDEHGNSYLLTPVK